MEHLNLININPLKNMKEPIKKARHYSNVTICKLHNKRVIVFKNKKNDFTIIFKIFTKDNDADEPRSKHYNLKDKVVSTVFNLSRDGAESLIYALRKELDKSNDTEETINLNI